MRGMSRFWSEFQGVFDERFRSYVTGEFTKKAAPADMATAAAPG